MKKVYSVIYSNVYHQKLEGTVERQMRKSTPLAG